MVRVMGTFDEWQAQKDSQYILATTYLENLAKEHNSTIGATANYLIHCDTLKEIYEKSDDGEYYPIYEPTGYGYYDDTPPPRIQFLNNAKTNTDNTGKILSRDFYKAWDNHYFKKSELPPIEPVKPSEPQASEINSQITLLQRDPFLTNLDIFNVIEASCLISGDDPIQIEICLGDTYFKHNNIEYLKAESLINAGIKSGKLDPDITRQSLQKFLKKKGYIIAGFNDNLPHGISIDDLTREVFTPTPKDSQLSQQVADLTAQLERAKAENESLNLIGTPSIGHAPAIPPHAKATIEQLRAENAELKTKLGILEQAGKASQSDTPVTYTTTPILALNAVVKEFWLQYDPQANNATKQHTIKEWVKENYPEIGDTMALWIDKIARHPTAK